jgi:hypothetical protein
MTFSEGTTIFFAYQDSDVYLPTDRERGRTLFPLVPTAKRTPVTAATVSGCSLGPALVDGKFPTVHHFAVERGNRSLSFLVAAHFNESEAF